MQQLPSIITFVLVIFCNVTNHPKISVNIFKNVLIVLQVNNLGCAQLECPTHVGPLGWLRCSGRLDHFLHMALLLSPSSQCLQHDRPKVERQSVGRGISTLFGKPADGEDDRVLKNHLT